MASSTKRRVASSSISFLSTDGWAEKSKSARVNGDGSEAKRARLARRRSSTAVTSMASSRSKNPWWVSFCLHGVVELARERLGGRGHAQKGEMRTQLLILGALGHAGTWVAPGKARAMTFAISSRSTLGSSPALPNSRARSLRASLAGRLVGLAVTGTCGAELAEHDRLEGCPVLGGAHHGAGSWNAEAMRHELDPCGGEDLEAPGAEPVPQRELDAAHPRRDRVAVASEGHARLVVDEPCHLDRGRVGNRGKCHQHLGIGELTNASARPDALSSVRSPGSR